MNDVIPPDLADLLREWRAHDGRANPCQCEEDLAAWVDEHLPPDLGPVGPDTPWGSLCRSRYGVEAIFVGASSDKLVWFGEPTGADYDIETHVFDGWRVVRSGPAEPEPERESCRTLSVGDEVIAPPCRVVINRITGSGASAAGDCSTCRDRHVISRFAYLAGRGPWHPATTEREDQP